MNKISFHKSLLFKLTVWYIVFLGFTIVLAGIFFYQGVKERQARDLDKVLIKIADGLNDEWRSEKVVTLKEVMEKFEKYDATYSTYIMLV